MKNVEDRNFLMAQKIEGERFRHRRLEAVKINLLSALAAIDWRLGGDVFDERNHLSESRLKELEQIVLRAKELTKNLRISSKIDGS